jgi:hypothetical protein
MPMMHQPGRHAAHRRAAQRQARDICRAMVRATMVAS